MGCVGSFLDVFINYEGQRKILAWMTLGRNASEAENRVPFYV